MSFAEYGDIQAPTDDPGDIFEGHAFFSDCVIASPRGVVFECEPIEDSRIEPVHGRPAIEALADVGCRTLLPRKVDEDGNESVIAIAVNRRCETDDRRLHATCD